MYIHIRTTRVLRNTAQVMRIVGELNRLMTANTGAKSEMWISSLSPSPGTLAFTTPVQGRGEVAELAEKLMTVPEVLGLIEEIRPYITPPVDQFRYILNEDSLQMDEGSQPIVSTMNAQVVGDLGAAFEWSLEMASFVTGVVGSRVMLNVNTIGPIGQLQWAVGFDDMDAVDAAEVALWNDPGYMERIAKAREAELFQPGVGGQSLWSRID